MITPATIAVALFVAVAGVTLVFALMALAPARTVLRIDTAMGVTHVRVRPLFGVAPTIEFARTPKARKGLVAKLVQGVRDLPRMAHAALALPGLVAPARRLLGDVDALKPSTKRIVLFAPAVHPVATLLLEVANGLPDSVRRGVEVRTRDGLSIDFLVHVEADAAPLKLWIIYRRVRRDPGVQQFLLRLRK